MNTMLNNIRLTLIGAFILSVLCVNFAQAQEEFLGDSSLSIYSVEDLVKIRKILASEREKLLDSQEKIRERGVDVTREFLGKTKEENSNQDKILIRVAEYYIEEEDLEFERRFDEYDEKYLEYERQQKAFENGELSVSPAEPLQPKQNYEKAIAIYDLIIKNFPESDLVDDAYYNKAYLLEEMEETVASRQIFQTIIDEYPESKYAPEAYMKLAESFFYPEPGDSLSTTILKLNKAIQLYKNVLEYKDSPRYDEALYKLGWSYYRLAGENPDYYTEAIIHFMAVVQDIDRLKELDPTGEIVRADVKPEALQFIAASFIDPNYAKSGVDNARGFIEKLERPQFGIDVMENMGDRYAKITKWNEAISAYSQLLDMYPGHAYAPRVQKKIADAFIADEQFERAFEERKMLFESYNPKSEWYAQLEQRNIEGRIAALDEAYRITEEAFRTNINYLFTISSEREAEGESAIANYEEFVNLCNRYLENYPTDENAYEINWALAFVLDTKLSRFEEAFTEYIRVSNDYLETNHQLDAAVNAINAADTLVKIARAADDPTVLDGDQLANRLPSKDLSPEENLLAEAYDNFIKLFPDSPETPSVLAAAGALYYNHRQFDLAKKYYKTMVTKFPGAQQKSIGLISLMNSYFFLGQYRDAEVVAKKILTTPDIPSEQVEIAKNRIGESIYKNGEKLEQEERYLEAAKEYIRVYEEASEYVTFVDLSLFKGARNYEQADEWLRAIETYELLVNNFPQSKQVLPALNNIAADYKELEDFLNVARTNERIFDTFPGTKEAENALFNASLFYDKAEAWQEAIRANNVYIKSYPSNPESKDLLFENAKYYLKLDDLASANQIYEEFASLYPNDPLTVEAFYNRGVYYFDQNDFNLAKAEFNKAIDRSNNFARAGRDPNLFFAAEANYKLGEILYTEYKDITLGYPQQQLRAALDRKRNKLDEVQETFTRVIGLGSIRSFEAMYRIAESYEEFANAIANQELDPSLSRDKQLVEEDRVFKAAVPAYDRAVEEYKNVLINLPTLAEKLEISLDSTSVKDEEVVAVDSLIALTDSALVKKEIEADSSSAVAIKWYDRAKEKISLIQYQVAEKSSDFVTEYLRVENPNSGIRALVFEDQVLKQLVAPQVQTTIEAHLKNIAVSEELKLENKYVEESKRKVLLARNILAQEYEALFNRTVNIYRESVPTLERLIEGGEESRTQDGMDYYDFQDNYLMQLTFFTNQFSKIAMNQYKVTLQVAQDNNINNDAKQTTEQAMFNFGYEAGEALQNLSELPTSKSEYYITRFDSTQNENYQLGSTFFDDQAFELKGYSEEIFGFVYDISKELEIENVWTRLTLAKLVEIDPATYLEDLPKEEVTVQSDTSWSATTAYSPGWNLEEFIDNGMGRANSVSVPFDLKSPVFDSLQVAPTAVWIGGAASVGGTDFGGNPLEMQDRLNSDTLAVSGQDSVLFPPDASALGDSAMAALTGDTLTAYFRKRFYLSNNAIDGYIAVAGDDSYRLYINDIYINGKDADSFEKADVISFSTFSEFLKKGENLISVSVTDFDGEPRYGLKFHLSVKLLPGEITDTINKIRQTQQSDINPATLRKTVTLNKNRIVQ